MSTLCYTHQHHPLCLLPPLVSVVVAFSLLGFFARCKTIVLPALQSCYVLLCFSRHVLCAADLSGGYQCDTMLQESAQAVACLCVSFGTRANGPLLLLLRPPFFFFFFHFFLFFFHEPHPAIDHACVVSQGASLDHVNALGNGTMDDFDFSKEAAVERRCSDAFAAVQHFEKTHCLALQHMALPYLQRRPQLVATCLTQAAQLGLKDEVSHDAVLLMDRTMSTGLEVCVHQL